MIKKLILILFLLFLSCSPSRDYEIRKVGEEYVGIINVNGEQIISSIDACDWIIKQKWYKK